MSLPENPAETPVNDGIFRGWWLIVLSGIIMAMASFLLEDILDLIGQALSQELALSQTTLASAPIISLLSAGLIGPAVGYITDKIGPRRTVRIGLCVLIGGFVLLSLTNIPLMLFLALLLMGMGAGLCGWIPLMTLLVRRFFRRLTAAIVVFEVISGVGGLVLIPLASLIFVYRGWRMVPIFLAGLALLLVIPVFVLLRNRPEGMGQRAYSALPAASQQFGLFSVSSFRVRSYWLIVFGAAFSLMAEVGIVIFLGLMMADRGFAYRYSGFAIAILSFLSIAFIVVGGVMAVRVPRPVLLGCFAGLQAVGTGGLVFADSLVEFYLFAALLGASYGGISPLIVPILADYFGTASIGKILGVYFLVTQLLPVFVHNIGAVMYATGQSNTFLLFLTGLALLSALCFVMARPPRAPDAVVSQVETG